MINKIPSIIWLAMRRLELLQCAVESIAAAIEASETYDVKPEQIMRIQAHICRPENALAYLQVHEIARKEGGVN